MTHIRTAGRFVRDVLAYTARIWFEDRHRERTRAYNRAHPAPGHRTKSGWVAQRRQDIDE